jgi:signal transduction histidine kinase
MPQTKASAQANHKRSRSAAPGAALRHVERFQSLVDELSAAMAHASVGEIDKEIEKWLQRIVLALGVDRGIVWERAATDGVLVGKQTWVRPGLPKFTRMTLSTQVSSWAAAQLFAGKLVVYSSPDKLPKEATDLKRYLRFHGGPKASFMMPLQIGDLVVGALTFGKFRAPRDWSPNELRRLRIVGQILAAALDRKRVVLQALKLRQELVVASRRSTLGELAASIAHELNQPLAAILSTLNGLVRLLPQISPKPATAVAALRSAIGDTKRAADIVRRLKAMFTGDEISKVGIALGPTIKDVVKLVDSEAMAREITVRIDDSRSLPLVVGDRVQIQQCVLNLLMNALDATAQVKSGPREVTIEIGPEKDGWIGISVRDSGGGVDPSIADHIFEPFITTKPKGMGLGLLVTRSIVDDHGGRIWFSENPKGGSIFTFTLPVMQPERVRASRGE